jgi:hypothetical protein
LSWCTDELRKIAEADDFASEQTLNRLAREAQGNAQAGTPSGAARNAEAARYFEAYS